MHSFPKTALKPKPMCVREIASAPWNNGKEALKWHKFALREATLPVENQNACASPWDVECKGRSVRASMASNCYCTTALQNFATEPCVVPFPWLPPKFAVQTESTRGGYLRSRFALFTKTSELSGRPADLFTLQANTILHTSYTSMKNISRFS